MKKVAISGYFDPLHVGHLEYISLSRKLGDYLIVIVNNNHQCKLKKGKPFMDEKDRIKIVEALEYVDEVFLSIDKDKTVCKKYGIQLLDGLGKKITSSSYLTGLKSI